MALDWPASAEALWELFDRGGPRPEYVLPVLYAESGFDPSISNLAGAPYYGVNQASEALIASYAGTDVQTYESWPASQQIRTVVAGMLLNLVRQYGALRSGARVYQANFLPATLATAHGLSDVVTAFPSAAYQSNSELDFARTGSIRVSDLAHFVQHAANTAAVRSAIGHVYAERPNETPREPVYGEDFPSFTGAGAIAMAMGLTLLFYALGGGKVG